MESATIRIGVIGAGAVMRERHLPNLMAMDDVDLAAVANASMASANAVATRFGVASIARDWQDLIGRPDIDAVMIATPPDQLGPIVIAALRAGKHVLCQPPLGRDLADARAMLAAARQRPDLVSMVCHGGRRGPGDDHVRSIIRSGALGTLTAVDVLHTTASRIAPVAAGWREDSARAGRLTLAMDSYAEALDAWVGPYESISAVATTPIASKVDVAGCAVTVNVPQVVMVLGLLENGAAGVEYHGGLSPDLTTPRDLVAIYGTEGVLRYYFDARELKLASTGGELTTIDLSAVARRASYAEADFVAAIRRSRQSAPWSAGGNQSFDDGVAVMRKLEAIHIAARTGHRVTLAAL